MARSLARSRLTRSDAALAALDRIHAAGVLHGDIRARHLLCHPEKDEMMWCDLEAAEVLAARSATAEPEEGKGEDEGYEQATVAMEQGGMEKHMEMEQERAYVLELFDEKV